MGSAITHFPKGTKFSQGLQGVVINIFKVNPFSDLMEIITSYTWKLAFYISIDR